MAGSAKAGGYGGLPYKEKRQSPRGARPRAGGEGSAGPAGKPKIPRPIYARAGAGGKGGGRPNGGPGAVPDRSGGGRTGARFTTVAAAPKAPRGAAGPGPAGQGRTDCGSIPTREAAGRGAPGRGATLRRNGPGAAAYAGARKRGGARAVARRGPFSPGRASRLGPGTAKILLLSGGYYAGRVGGHTARPAADGICSGAVALCMWSGRAPMLSRGRALDAPDQHLAHHAFCRAHLPAGHVRDAGDATRRRVGVFVRPPPPGAGGLPPIDSPVRRIME